MENKDLLIQVTQLYADARKSVEGYKSESIKRGRNHSISSMAEDLLAHFISKRIDISNKELWVDYPISYDSPDKHTKKGHSKKQTIYADIAIAKRESESLVVTHIVDLKLDLGWKRSLDELKTAINDAIVKTKHMQAIGSGQFKQLDDGGLKEKHATLIKFSSDLKWHVIVMSNKNISDSAMKKNVEYAESQQNHSSFRFYTFSEGEHPNGGNPIPIDSEITRFIKELNS